jgi:enoyl-CoA hydratase/carnithine racemase
MSEVQVTTSDGACEIVLMRPARKNALTMAMYQALTEALQVAGKNDDIRAVLIRGEGGSFSAGNDLMDFMQAQDAAVREDSPVSRFLSTLVGFEKPLVAAVEGHAVGIGTTMLLHCDLVYATPDAKLQLPFVNLALVPEAASSFLLPRLLGHARAAELLYFGEPFSGAEAYQLGIVNQLRPKEELVDYARGRVKLLVEKPAESLRQTKKLLRAPLAEETKNRMRAEGVVFAERLQSAELREAITAFFEKRTPKFR